MNLFTILYLISTVLSKTYHIFRYKNGIIKIGNDNPIKVSGTAMYIDQGMKVIQYFGMEMSTRTRYIIIGVNNSPNNNDGDNYVFTCKTGRWSNNKVTKLDGTIKITGTWDKAEIIGSCLNKIDLKEWTIKSNGIGSKTIPFDYKEAGLRARYLIGKDIKKYMAYTVISYAIFDYPYLRLDCKRILDESKQIEGPKPGILVVGKDGKHCGIIDNEGDKLIHSNPVKGVVTENPMPIIGQFFPNGYVFTDYPPLFTY